MRFRFIRRAIVLAMAVVALLLAVDIAYLVSGSLEQFPTAEQEDKVRIVSSAIAVLLIVIEIALWVAHRSLRHDPHAAPGE